MSMRPCLRWQMCFSTLLTFSDVLRAISTSCEAKLGHVTRASKMCLSIPLSLLIFPESFVIACEALRHVGCPSYLGLKNSLQCLSCFQPAVIFQTTFSAFPDESCWQFLNNYFGWNIKTVKATTKYVKRVHTYRLGDPTPPPAHCKLPKQRALAPRKQQT